MKKVINAFGLFFVLTVLCLVGCVTKIEDPNNDPNDPKTTYKIEYLVDDTVYETQEYEKGAMIVLPDAPNTKEGYTFVKWDMEYTTMPEQNVTTNAIFVKNSYTVIYYLNNEIYKQYTVDFGDVIPVPDSPVLEDGVIFTGWKLEYDTMPSNDIFVYANTSEGNLIDVSTLSDAEVYTISDAGLYILTGTNKNAAIQVSSSGDVELALWNLNLSYQGTDATISVAKASSFKLTVLDRTMNEISDSENNTSDAAISVKKCDFVIEGSGKLKVTSLAQSGLYNSKNIVISDVNLEIEAASHGVNGKTSVTMKSGNLIIYSGKDAFHSGDGFVQLNDGSVVATASGDGIDATLYARIKDGIYSFTTEGDGVKAVQYVLIEGSTLTIKALEDGIKANGDATGVDLTIGYVQITGGDITIDALYDGIQAETELTISTLEVVNIMSGKGYMDGKTLYDANNEAISMKGMKGKTITLEEGIYTINSFDDAIHSKGDISVNGGTYTIHTGDDAVHADATLTMNGGEMLIERSYEGLEAMDIILNDGTVRLTATDDGINGAGGIDTNSNEVFGPAPESSTNHSIIINGGYYIVNSTGDGIDCNGSVIMNGGIVIVNGPTSNRDGSLDYDTTWKQTGGFLFAIGSSGMAQAPSNGSTQNSISVTFNSTLSSDTFIRVYCENVLDFVFKSSKSFNNFVLSSPELVTGNRYTVSYGGSYTEGEATDNVYTSGIYEGGTVITTLTISSFLTSYGTISTGGSGRPGGRP